MKLSASFLSFLCLPLLATLCACEHAPTPDNRIKLMPSADGRRLTVVPPECLSWTDYESSPSENHPWPQYGCATARNLAAQVARPEDLMEPRDLGTPDSYVTAAAIGRYQSGKTTPLINPNETAPTEVIKMEDSRVGGGQSK